mmetsp:Transcript_46350/g.75646  ORF Transcript_46350/g.75646 Transcript_46350/m.75646 type:complete len:865 (+) Transcript_46350:135-2729(+)|eukprot:CAMPEP_0184652578 /NCGR_PEP_ID=MMETSP0308-20130426/10279_1 /TAXON_ID=38269 /ORGANISM="Gloeochaete witrockiana, Strain SAG 46.84" /LENGTH=864 /DNA_ID=CAMNT_0027087545 /DNA_START=53 /DNA_END=2647 /DNA_ORIENTATION=-
MSSNTLGSPRIDEPWVLAQSKAFAKFFNSYLNKRGINIVNLVNDLDDGVILTNIIEEMSKEKLPRIKQSTAIPNVRTQKLYNIQSLNIPLNFINSFLEKSKLKLKFSAEDILEHNVKMILGMSWVLIHKYAIEEIAEEDLSQKEALMLWVQKKTAGYKDVTVKDFTLSWQSGLAFCALIHRHNPDLIDFSSLSKDNRLQNLQLAFDVAEKQLGIPCILDANDMVNQKPDDKSVLAQVAFYWKKFAAEKTAEVATKRISKLIEREKSLYQLQKEYEFRTAELLDWMGETAHRFEQKNFGALLEDVQALIAKHNDYKRNEKVARLEEKYALEVLLASIIARMRATGRPSYQPPEKLTPQETDLGMQKLAILEGEYEAALLLELAKKKKLDRLMQRFQAKAKKFSEWLQERHEFLSQTEMEKFSSVGDVQASLQRHDAFEDEVQANDSRLDTLRSLSAPLLGQTGYDEIVQQSLKVLDDEWQRLRLRSQLHKQHLQAELARQQEIQLQRLEYAKAAEAFNLWMEELFENLDEPVATDSIEEAQAVIGGIELIGRQKDSKNGDFQRIEGVARLLEQAGVVDNPYTRFAISALRDKWGLLDETLAEKRRAGGEELELQKQNEDLRREYASTAQGIKQWLTQLQNAVNTKTARGTKQDRIKALQDSLAEFVGQKSRIDDLKALDQKIVTAGITDIRALSIQTVEKSADTLEKCIRETLRELESEVASTKVTIPPDQVKEITTSFHYFDKDFDGKLQLNEFMSCVQSLDVEIDPAEVEKMFHKHASRQGDVEVIDMDGFLRWISTRLEETETKETIADAFRQLAKGKPYIVPEDLRILRPDEIEFLLSKMPAVSAGYDFNAFILAIYESSN